MKRLTQLETIVRIDEALNGRGGVLAQMRQLNADVFGVKLVLVGGIDPATGKERSGLAQNFDRHISDHNRRDKRNFAILTLIVTTVVTGIRELLRFIGLG